MNNEEEKNCAWLQSPNPGDELWVPIWEDGFALLQRTFNWHEFPERELIIPLEYSE